MPFIYMQKWLGIERGVYMGIKRKGLLSVLLEIDDVKLDIKNLCEQRIEILEIRTSLPAIDYSKTGTPSGSVKDLAQSMIMLEDLDRRLAGKISSYCAKVVKAEEMMDKLRDRKACLYITKKYRLKKSLRRIGEEENVSKNYVQKKINNGLKI